MATIGELLVRLGLDPASYTKGLSTAESSTKSSAGNIGKHFDDAGSHVSKFGSVMHGVAVGVGVELTHLATEGVGKIVDVLKDAEKDFQDAAVSTAKLSTAVDNALPGLKAYPNGLKDTTAAVNDTLEANLNLGFSMDDQRNSMALLVGVTKNVPQAEKDMSEAMDLARLKGIDLASATNIVMKAQEGNTGALKKLGIVVAPVTTAMDALRASNEKATPAQIAAAKAADLQATETAALAGVTKLAGGQAEAYANTSAGKLAAAHAKVTEAMVKLGSITDQIVQAVLPALADAFENIMNAVGPVLTQIGSQMPAVISTAKGAFDTLKKALAPIMDAFSEALPAAIALAKTAFAGIVTAFNNIKTAIMPLLNNVLDPLRETFADLTKNQDALKGALIVLGGVVAAVVVPPMLAWAAATIAAVLPIIAIAAAVAALIVILDKTGMLDWLGKNVMPMVSAAGEYLSRNVLPVLSSAFNNIVSAVLPPLTTAMQFISGTVIPALSAAFDWIVKNVLPPLVSAFNWIATNVFPVLASVAQTAFKGIAQYISTSVDLAKSAFGVLQTAIGVVSSVFSGLQTAIGAVWSGITGGINTFVGFVQGIPGKITTAASGMFEGINRAFKSAINAIIGGWNGLQFKIPGFKIGPIGYDGFTLGVPKIPTLHSGGIVPGTPGTDVLALLQAGERVTSARDVARGGSGGNTFYITNPVPEPPSVSMAHANLMMAYSGRSGN